tara:strand:+ start:204 stop:620 length:417 start_codon:yes stop_codon:yes gene_type:complete
LNKLSDKDKSAWQEFIKSKDKIPDKDLKSTKKNFSFLEKTIDLHGYTLNDANLEIEKFILSCFDQGISKINIITGKGSRSKNKDDPYQSKDLSILKYSVPDYIKKNNKLMSKILKIDSEAIESPSKGNFEVILKVKNV